LNRFSFSDPGLKQPWAEISERLRRKRCAEIGERLRRKRCAEIGERLRRY
jgi:hypothetical protein